MKKRAKPVGKKAPRKVVAKKRTARSSAGPAKRGSPAARPAPSRPAGPPRDAGVVDRAAVEAARYTPSPVQSTGWPPFRYPPQ